MLMGRPQSDRCPGRTCTARRPAAAGSQAASASPASVCSNWAARLVPGRAPESLIIIALIVSLQVATGQSFAGISTLNAASFNDWEEFDLSGISLAGGRVL